LYFRVQALISFHSIVLGKLILASSVMVNIHLRVICICWLI
jgi:hypothetical protein